MRPIRLSRLAMTASLLTASLVAAAPNPNPDLLPGWVRPASVQTKAFPAVVTGVAKRPSILLETDYYVYGPGTGFTTPELNLTVNDRNYDEAVTYYLYWENRTTGAKRYFNLPSGGFVNQERDLFGSGATPVKVVTGDLDEFQLFGPDGALGPFPASLPTATGLYQFVFEIRNAAGTKAVSRGNAMYNNVDGVVSVGGNVGSNQNWTNNNVYFLASPVNVQSGATLTIEAGTVILGSNSGQGTLVIRQGAKIEAEGDDMRPIIFTSEFPVGQRSAGNWGGLVINGFAPTNQQNPQGEGDSGPYGGNDPNDNSGTLRYVRVEFAGIRFSDQNELNGIAMQGVGRGTTVDHIQVHFNQDDGIEFFGGTVDVKYVLITDAEDDSFDWTFGWQGRAQHVVILQRFDSQDHGIEADNFENDPNIEPRSNPTIYNATFIGNKNATEFAAGLMLRRGTGVTLGQSIVTNFADFAAVTGSDAEADWALVSITRSFFFNNEGISSNDTERGIIENPANMNRFTDPQIINPNSQIQPDPSPRTAAIVNVGASQPNDGFFDSVPWAGGVNPNDPWTDDGWTTFSDN